MESPAPHPVAPVPVVVGHGLVKSWGSTKVFDGASFAIAEGITGLLGANGSGKTTLIGMILGLHRPEQGTLTVFGQDPASAGPEIRARIGYSPEHHVLPPDLRAHDLVAHIARVHGLPRREATTRASDALWMVGLGEERYRAIGTMSTGQRQRVKLAQAIAHDPALVLLDEPTDGLDPVQRDEVLALIRRIGTEFGIHIVLSSHLLDEIERICDSVVILGDSTVRTSGSIESLMGDASGVRVVVDQGADQVGAALRERGFAATVAAAEVTIEVDLSGLDDALDQVRDVVADLGLPLRSLRPQRITLEDLYLQEQP